MKQYSDPGAFGWRQRLRLVTMVMLQVTREWMTEVGIDGRWTGGTAESTYSIECTKRAVLWAIWRRMEEIVLDGLDSDMIEWYTSTRGRAT